MDRYLFHPVITAEMAAGLAPQDERSMQAGMLGTDPVGLFKLDK